jgi:hypothetical protein
MVRTAELPRARAKHANEGQRPFALRRSDASLRCRLRRSADQRTHGDGGGKQQRSFRQSFDHDQPLPICTENCCFRLAEARRRQSPVGSVPRSKVTSQLVSNVRLQKSTWNRRARRCRKSSCAHTPVQIAAVVSGWRAACAARAVSASVARRFCASSPPGWMMPADIRSCIAASTVMSRSITSRRGT